MRCDECEPLLEDFLYHKPCASREEELAEHVTACDSCAREYALLRREQEIYSRSELQVAPQFWAGVQARIARENESRALRFADLFTIFRLAPVNAALACFLVVAGVIALWRVLEMRPGDKTAKLQTAPVVTAARTDQKSNAVSLTDLSKALINGEKRDPSSPRRLASMPTSRRSSGAVRAFERKLEQPGADALVEQTQLLAVRSDLDPDNARHLEQVEMLLRSFKNGRVLRNSETLDLTYESRLSKDLLVRNTLLRRDAELAGDVPLTRLLDQFEPFLVDIANLRDDSDAREIRQVKESLTRSQIIAALHSF